MHYSFLRIKSAKHQRIDGEKSPCRDGLKFPRQLKTSPIWRNCCSQFEHGQRAEPGAYTGT
ncbi:hypothetical protein AWE26_24050 [Escherichia coli]|nr:hypothetical protein AWE26_24050 [Escherichia coli]PDO47394.1 hypothetical protein AWE27_20510 [Escherichia coli]PDO55032.1 hypothetical protein AWE29_05870 [Escherichia coli]PDO67124.1 hypothetical protein AWE28_18775 [Escherichia coli]